MRTSQWPASDRQITHYRPVVREAPPDQGWPERSDREFEKYPSHTQLFIAHLVVVTHVGGQTFDPGFKT